MTPDLARRAKQAIGWRFNRSEPKCRPYALNKVLKLSDAEFNIAPYVYIHDLLPHDLKSVYGKRLWKRLCKNSFSRNIEIAQKVRYQFREDYLSNCTLNLESEWPRRPVQYYVNNLNILPSTLLVRLSAHRLCSLALNVDDIAEGDIFYRYTSPTKRYGFPTRLLQKLVDDLRKSRTVSTGLGGAQLLAIIQVYEDTCRILRRLERDPAPLIQKCTCIKDLRAVHNRYERKMMQAERRRREQERHIVEHTDSVRLYAYGPQPFAASRHGQFQDPALRIYDCAPRLITSPDTKLVARLLCSPDDLIDEGITMKHCIGSYVDDIAKGEYFVYSIYNADQVQDVAQRTTLSLKYRPNTVWRTVHTIKPIPWEVVCKSETSDDYATRSIETREICLGNWTIDQHTGYRNDMGLVRPVAKTLMYIQFGKYIEQTVNRYWVKAVTTGVPSKKVPLTKGPDYETNPQSI